MHWSLEKCWLNDYAINQMLPHFIMQHSKITFINITTNHIRKIFIYWEVPKPIMIDASFLYILILPKILNFIINK